MRKEDTTKQVEAPIVEQIHIRLHPELRKLLEEDANLNYPSSINDVVTRILAEAYNRPELAGTPKKRMGRPPKLRQPA